MSIVVVTLSALVAAANVAAACSASICTRIDESDASMNRIGPR